MKSKTSKRPDNIDAAVLRQLRRGFIDESLRMTEDRGSDNRPGEIYLANEDRFTESFFSEPLTAYAVGWRDPSNLEATLEFLAPAVPTPRRFEYAKATNSEEFLSETDDERAIGASFKMVEFTSSKVNAKTLNKGLTVRVDRDNVEGMPNWEQVYTNRLMRRLLRNELKRGVTLLAAAATNTAVTWDTTAGKDPDQDVRTRLIAGADVSGVYPTRVLYGDTAWNKRGIAHRAQTTAGGFASATMNEVQVAAQIGVQEVMVSRERYSSSSTAKTQIVNNLVLAYIAEAGMTPEDPSSIKRFVSAVEGGGRFRVYRQEVNSKLVDITVEHYSLIAVTSTLGIQKLTVS